MLKTSIALVIAVTVGCGALPRQERNPLPKDLEHLDWPILVRTLQDAAPDLPPLDLEPSARPFFYDLLDEEKAGVFGDACDVVGAPPIGRIAIIQIVARRRRTAVRYLLRFGSLAGRTYAAEALYLFQARGQTISQVDLERITELQQSTAPLEVCEGCDHSIQTPARVLNPEYLSEAGKRWKFFESLGWTNVLNGGA